MNSPGDFPETEESEVWTDDNIAVVFPPVEPVIWRYMHFEKFLNLLWSKTIHFSPLCCMEDKTEGALPLAAFEETKRQLPEDILEGRGAMDADTMLGELVRRNRKDACINSWYIGQSHSVGMWQSYAGRNGVAIQSTVHRLKSCFVNRCSRIIISPVRYFHPTEQAEKYAKEAQFGNHFIKYVKDETVNYEGENELRALTFKTDVGCDGVDLPIDVSILIESLVLSPLLEHWAVPVMTEVIRRFGFAGNIEHGTLPMK